MSNIHLVGVTASGSLCKWARNVPNWVRNYVGGQPKRRPGPRKQDVESLYLDLTIPYHTIPYCTTPYYAIPYHDIPYFARRIFMFMWSSGPRSKELRFAACPEPPARGRLAEAPQAMPGVPGVAEGVHRQLPVNATFPELPRVLH